MNRKNYVGANLDDATHADLKKFGEETERSKAKSVLYILKEYFSNRSENTAKKATAK